MCLCTPKQERPRWSETLAAQRRFSKFLKSGLLSNAPFSEWSEYLVLPPGSQGHCSKACCCFQPPWTISDMVENRKNVWNHETSIGNTPIKVINELCKLTVLPISRSAPVFAPLSKKAPKSSAFWVLHVGLTRAGLKAMKSPVSKWWTAIRNTGTCIYPPLSTWVTLELFLHHFQLVSSRGSRLSGVHYETSSKGLFFMRLSQIRAPLINYIQGRPNWEMYNTYNKYALCMFFG